MPAGTVSLEEFKARLPLAEIVGRYVRLTRKGREHVGLCPFHKEKTPSFNVVEGKGFYHCFGCGAHGTAIDFVMAVERCGFPEALERLAEITGIPAPSRREPTAPRVDRTLYDVVAAAAAWFRRQLGGASGAPARAYLERRGLEPAVQAAFGIGWAPPEWGALRRALAAEGFGEDRLVEAGLLVLPDDGGDAYDRFRERVIFPIQDGRGRVVGFGGRALGDAKPKYLNSPDGPLFHKGRLLYNLAGAGGPARERGTVIVAEGYVDVIALTQAGFANAVAPLGTAVTEEQMELLWKLSAEPIVCLDGDAAGLRAARRAAERALPLLKAGRSLRFALLPAGEDPDSLLRAQGPEALAACLAEPMPLVEFLWRQESAAAQPLDTPERRAALQRRLRELAATIGDGEVRGHYRAMLAERVAALFPSPWQRGRERGRAAGAALPASPALRSSRLDTDFLNERRIVAAIVAEPALLHEVEEELAGLELADPRSQRLREAVLDWYALTHGEDPASLRERLTQDGLAQLLPADEPDAAPDGTAEAWRLMVHQWRSARAQAREAEELARRSAAEGEGAWAAGLARIGAIIAEKAPTETENGGADFEAERRSHVEYLQDLLTRLRADRGHDPAEG